MHYPLTWLIVSSSTIDKMFEITHFTKKGTKFKFLQKLVRNFRKNVNFELVDELTLRLELIHKCPFEFHVFIGFYSYVQELL